MAFYSSWLVQSQALYLWAAIVLSMNWCKLPVGRADEQSRSDAANMRFATMLAGRNSNEHWGSINICTVRQEYFWQLCYLQV